MSLSALRTRNATPARMRIVTYELVAGLLQLLAVTRLRVLEPRDGPVVRRQTDLRTQISSLPWQRWPNMLPSHWNFV